MSYCLFTELVPVPYPIGDTPWLEARAGQGSAFGTSLLLLLNKQPLLLGGFIASSR